MSTTVSKRFDGDHGAAMVELALVLPVIALFALGILEFGMGWHAANQVEKAAGSAGRTGASQATAPLTDYDVLQSVSGSLARAGVDIQKVIVYRATGDGEPPAACEAIEPSGLGVFGVDGVCNVYSRAQVLTTNPATGFPRGSIASPSCAAGSWDANWCPINERDNEPPGIDRIGVYIEVERDTVTGILGVDSLEIGRHAVYQIEPEVAED